ncbi:MAG TPA: vWA domain-containing protein [Myxococcota bacterium]|nr:vWA domain-containing protein [Myxococcota bacterium]
MTRGRAAWILLAAAVALAPTTGNTPDKPKPAKAQPAPAPNVPTTPEPGQINTTAKKTADKAPELMLSIESPMNGSVIGDPTGMAFVSGKALALYGEYQTFDIIFVIDTSDSTAEPSGADIDGNGVVGEKRMAKYLSVFGRVLPLPSTDKGDSVLAAEIAACRVLLAQLDPRTTRVGVVTFAGDTNALTPDAQTEVPLTSDYAKVGRGLDAVFRRGPEGMTNMVSAINLATIELLGTQSAYSTKREGAKRVIMFLTDGQPTLPLEGAELQNAKMAIQQAVRAAKLDIRVDTFAIGEEALSEPVVVVEMARVSNGVFTPVKDPKNLRAIFEDVSFSSIEKLEVRNKTNGKLADYVVPNPDGTFSALLPMTEGKNTLEVYARSTDGTEGRREVEVSFLASAEPQELSPHLLAQKNRLLENRLLDLQRRNVEIKAEADEDTRRKLKLEIEQQRKEAQDRAEKTRREVEVSVEKQKQQQQQEGAPAADPPPSAPPSDSAPK